MLGFEDYLKLPVLDAVILTTDGSGCELLQEGQWISGRFPSNIRVDNPTHGAGQQHAHVYGRKGEELVVVNLDGSGSHGTQGRLHDKDVAALRKKGFQIPDGRVIEWVVVGPWQELLFS